MRKVIVCNIMSVDGYYEGPNKDVMALFDYRREAYPTDDSFDVYNAERLREADTLLLGRVSFEGFKSFWPHVADNPSPQFTPTQRDISRLNNTIDKVVISDTLTPEQTEPWVNTRIITRENAHKQIAELKGQMGKDILIFGSHTLWSDLLAHDLVDELHLMIASTIVGAGTPIFNSQPNVSLRLLDTRTWDDSGNVLVRYRVHRQNESPSE